MSDHLKEMLIRQWELAEELADRVADDQVTAVHGKHTGPYWFGANCVVKAIRKKRLELEAAG